MISKKYQTMLPFWIWSIFYSIFIHSLKLLAHFGDSLFKGISETVCMMYEYSVEFDDETNLSTFKQPFKRVRLILLEFLDLILGKYNDLDWPSFEKTFQWIYYYLPKKKIIPTYECWLWKFEQISRKI